MSSMTVMAMAVLRIRDIVNLSQKMRDRALKVRAFPNGLGVSGELLGWPVSSRRTDAASSLSSCVPAAWGQ